MVHSCVLLALSALPALGMRSDVIPALGVIPVPSPSPEDSPEQDGSGRNGPGRDVCQRIQSFSEEEVEHCEELLGSMQELLNGLNCSELKSTLVKGSSSIKKGMVAHAGKDILRGVVGLSHLEALHAVLEGTEAVVEVAAPHGEHALQYKHERKVHSLTMIGATATVALFAIGLTADLFSLGASFGTGTLLAAKAATFINVATSAVGWTHDFSSKLPTFRKFSRLVGSKCRFLNNMAEVQERLRRIGLDDDVPWVGTDEEEHWVRVVHQKLMQILPDDDVPLPEEEEGDARSLEDVGYRLYRVGLEDDVPSMEEEED